MSFAEFTSIKDEMENNPSLCNLFQLIATETWKRMEFAYTVMEDKISETTITENLLFTINVFKEKYDFDIKFESSTNERTNGHDIEFILGKEDSTEVFYAPMQAKRLYSNGNYSAYPHGGQILKLIEYATKDKKNGFPMYLLYNFKSLTALEKANLIKKEVCDKTINETQFGCTIVSALFLKENHFRIETNPITDETTYHGNLNFDDIHPNIAAPWQVLVCCESDDFSKLSTKLLQYHKDSITRKPIIEKVLNDKALPGLCSKNEISNVGWQNKFDYSIKDNPPININDNKFKEKLWAENPDEYSPRFRISFTIPSYLEDTVLVHAKPESYAKLLENPYLWGEIKIGKKRLETTKYIAFYVSNPTKQILSFAKIDKFSPNLENNKFTIYFNKIEVLKNPISYDGKRVKSIGRVYISLRKLEKSKNWNQLFENKKIKKQK